MLNTTRTDHSATQVPKSTTKSSGIEPESCERRMIQDERASVAPVEIGGDGAVMRPAKAVADLTPGVAFPPRGELASERTPGGQGARGTK